MWVVLCVVLPKKMYWVLHLFSIKVLSYRKENQKGFVIWVNQCRGVGRCYIYLFPTTYLRLWTPTNTNKTKQSEILKRKKTTIIKQIKTRDNKSKDLPEEGSISTLDNLIYNATYHTYNLWGLITVDTLLIDPMILLRLCVNAKPRVNHSMPVLHAVNERTICRYSREPARFNTLYASTQYKSWCHVLITRSRPTQSLDPGLFATSFFRCWYAHCFDSMLVVNATSRDPGFHALLVLAGGHPSWNAR